ncbi:MAG: calcium-binding protein [Candidatus Pacebacteria bacterium]|nr:calcium-binding protein [Candidatus Paceibacterota bacterium]
MFDSTTSYFENDSDSDGLTDGLENYYGTDINNPDTDGDGYSDGDEVNNGYDPLVPGGAKLDINK